MKDCSLEVIRCHIPLDSPVNEVVTEMFVSVEPVSYASEFFLALLCH